MPSLHSVHSGGSEHFPGAPSHLQVVSPSTGETIERVACSAREDVDAAIESAKQAFCTWSATSPMERSRILLKAVALLRERNDELAAIETKDTGKPFSETSTVDIVTGADVLEYYANLVGGGGLNGETIQLREDAWVYTKKEPLGVCCGIGAWNYPIQIALWKSAPCLAAGNAMVYKPSEFTPLHAKSLAEIYQQAGLPNGCFNVVIGGKEVGSYLVSHPSIAKVSFTGQVSTGKQVAGSAGAGMKYFTGELGGKSPLIILPDADLESAVDGSFMANFYSTGQVFIPRAIKVAFEKRVCEKTGFIRMGDLMDPKTNFGPLVSQVHHDKVLSYIRHGVEEDKAKLLHGGLEKPKLRQEHENGFWIQPTVFTNCTDGMRIVQEEIFGPVMCILTYDSIEEAIERANKTPLGLAAGVFTKDLKAAHTVIAKLQAGITWVNTWGESPAEMSVGGWKQSGLGVENGKRGLEAWVRNKSTLIDMSGSVATVFSELRS